MEIEKMIELIDAVSKSELTGFKYEEDGVKLHLSKKENRCYVTENVSTPVNMTGTSSTIPFLAGRNFLCGTCRRRGSLRKSRRQSRKRTDTGNRRSNETDE